MQITGKKKGEAVIKAKVGKKILRAKVVVKKRKDVRAVMTINGKEYGMTVTNPHLKWGLVTRRMKPVFPLFIFCGVHILAAHITSNLLAENVNVSRLPDPRNVTTCGVFVHDLFWKYGQPSTRSSVKIRRHGYGSPFLETSADPYFLPNIRRPQKSGIQECLSACNILLTFSAEAEGCL